MSDRSIRRLWIFDFDGTISSLVADRNVATIDPDCERTIRSLVQRKGETVAVVSSRSVDDLIARIPFGGLVCGGNSGAEWIMQDGRRLGPSDGSVRRYERIRTAVDPVINDVGRHPGVEIEEKHWSVAVHYRKADQDVRAHIEHALSDIVASCGVGLFRGPEAFEISLIRSATKRNSIRKLCRCIGGLDPSSVICAGDDENDADAMKWVLANGGIAVAVGNRVHMDGAIPAATPSELAGIIDMIWTSCRTPDAVHRQGSQQ